ncbi:hypothetical protein K1719_004825 [Acacia pycnantha]|nr:hypothetical protein K1719_004825 [Acacia pycnantha]
MLGNLEEVLGFKYVIKGHKRMRTSTTDLELNPTSVLVGTDNQVRQVLPVEKKAKFTDMKSLVFLVGAKVLVAVYSLIQGFRGVVSMIRGSVLISKPIAWLIFSAVQWN